MPVVKATEKGQVVIPAGIRKKYHISKGTKIIILDKDKEIVMRPLFKEPIKEARGIFKKGSSALEALMKDRKEEAKK
jgi:AbrB family looped-hinge helix DNA binding protein